MGVSSKQDKKDWPGSAASVVDFEFPVPPGQSEKDKEQVQDEAKAKATGDVMRITYRHYHSRSKQDAEQRKSSKLVTGVSLTTETAAASTSIPEVVHIELPPRGQNTHAGYSDSDSSDPPTPPPKPSIPLMRTKDLPKLKINDTPISSSRPAWVTRKVDMEKVVTHGHKKNPGLLAPPAQSSALKSGPATSISISSQVSRISKVSNATVSTLPSSPLVRRKSRAASVRSGRSCRSTRSTISGRTKSQCKSKSMLISSQTTTTQVKSLTKSRLSMFSSLSPSSKAHPNESKPLNSKERKRRKDMNRLTLTDPRSPFVNFKPVSGLGRGSSGTTKAKSGIAVGTTACLGTALGVGIRAHFDCEDERRKRSGGKTRMQGARLSKDCDFGLYHLALTF